MLELEVQLPRGRKIIEWDRASPTFCEVKERLGDCGITKNWFVEILQGGEYVSLDDDTQLRDCKKLTVRAAPISEKIFLEPGTSSAFRPAKSEILIEREKPDLAEMIENVTCFIGRIYICDEKCPDSSATAMQNCRGTVGLVGSSGESIGCWHTIEDAASKRSLQRMFIEYPNYPKPLLFEAQIKANLVSSDLDLFVAGPCELLPEETAHLSAALDVSLADNVHCFGYPEILSHELLEGYSRKKRDQRRRSCKFELQRELRIPTVSSGRVCFNGWKQAVADYLCFTNSSGGIVVDDYGRLKGVHVAAFRAGRTLNNHSLRVLKGNQKQRRFKAKCSVVNLQSSVTKLHSKLSKLCFEAAYGLNSCKSEVAAFAPVHNIEEPLQMSRMHLIRGKQPHIMKKRVACEHLSRTCLIRSTQTPAHADTDQDDDNEQFNSVLLEKKLKTQLISKQNPLIWF